MKSLFTCLFLLLLLTKISAQGNKHLIKSFKISKQHETIVLDFPFAKANSQVWKSPHLRLELEIYANVPNEVLESLMRSGRYQTEAHTQGNELIIKGPKMLEAVMIGQVQLEERIHVVLRTPDSFELQDRRFFKTIDPTWLSEQKPRKTRKAKRLPKGKVEVNLVFRGSDDPEACPYQWKNAVKLERSTR